jgi:magnesium transporter
MNKMEVFVCRAGSHHIDEGFTAEDLPELLADEGNVIWIDIESPNETDDKILAETFHFHPLTIEDARETRNQPKVEGFADYIFFIVHGVTTKTHSFNFETKELDGYLGKNFVVTYHHEHFRSIENVKRQLRANAFACHRGASYLLQQILDQIVDYYMPVVEDFDTSISELEERVFALNRPSNQILEEIMGLKRSVARLRRISAKQLQVLYRFSHGEFPLIDDQTLPFYRDVHDHLLRIVDLSESYRDLVGGLSDIHLSVIANKTNEVMKVLAVFSAIMLPLSLIAGIYGMNFENMPELHTRNGYYFAIGLMVFIAAGLLIYFWRKGWIFESNELESKDDKKHKTIA